MKSFFSRLLIVFIFGFLPAISGFLVVSQLIGHRENARVAAVEKRLREQLVQVADASSPQSFYFTLFNRLFSRLQQYGPVAGEKLTAGIRTAQRLWGHEISVYYFDARGEYVTLPGYAPANRFIVSKIWDILAETATYRPGDEQRQQKLIQTLLGSEANAGNLKKLEGQLVSLKKKRMNGYLYWNRLSPQSQSGVLIIVFPLLQTHTILARLQSIAGATRPVTEKPGMKIAFWSHEATIPLFSSDAGDNFTLLRAKIEKSPAGLLLENDRAWSIISTPGGVFLGSLPVEGRQKVAATGMVNLLMAAISALFLALIMSPRFNPQRIYMKIGNKLLAILLVAITFPTGGLLLIGVVAVDAHERFLLSRLEKDQLTRLSTIEDDFARESVSFAESCKALQIKTTENYSYESFVENCRQMIDSGQAVRIELRSLDGERIHLAETGGWFAGLDKTQDAYGRYQIITTMTERSKLEGITVKRRPDAVLCDAFASEDFGFAQITRLPGRVLPFRFGQNELYWYWARIETPGHPAALLNIYQARNVARERFLQRILQQKPSEPVILAAYDQNRRTWLNKEFNRQKIFNPVMRAAVLTGKPQMQVVAGNAGKHIALAFPGTVLAPFSLMAIVDETLVSNRIR
ncbi:MAG: hypothetical protein PHD82_13745, partial [Candidatus Riflebacteria bacterium]|nr:hypothetical protein [Candidatus Riflebacteria bacterium]